MFAKLKHGRLYGVDVYRYINLIYILARIFKQKFTCKLKVYMYV